MVAAESLHDRSLVEELNPLAQAGRLVDRLDGHVRLTLALDDVLGDALVHHAERALAQLSQDFDFLAGHLPLVLLVHCVHSHLQLVNVDAHNIVK